MSELETDLVQDKPCFDPECAGTAEPDKDGDHMYWTCGLCGSEFDYERVGQNPEAGACSIGVPESVRQRFSNEPTWEPPEPEATPVTLGPRRR
jgi:hypothetical protein